jgi:hypothetical protein
MLQLRILAPLASAALLVLVPGCSTQSTGAGSSRSNLAAPPSAGALTNGAASELAGTWRGTFHQIGGDGFAQGDMTLEIKDDGTYRLISIPRRGGSSNDSGVVAANGRGVTLKSSSGQWTPLTRTGDTLYGMLMDSNGRPVKVIVERSW